MSPAQRTPAAFCHFQQIACAEEVKEGDRLLPQGDNSHACVSQAWCLAHGGHLNINSSSHPEIVWLRAFGIPLPPHSCLLLQKCNTAQADAICAPPPIHPIHVPLHMMNVIRSNYPQPCLGFVWPQVSSWCVGKTRSMRG